MATGTEGNDNLTNDTVAGNDTITALGGDDVITVNPPQSAGFERVINVSGGEGFDTLIINASNYISYATPSGFNGQLRVRQGLSGGWTVNWTSIERLELNGAQFFGDFTLGDEIDIVRLTPGFGGKVSTGAGNDEIYVTGTGSNVRVGADGGTGDDIIDFTGLTAPGATGRTHQAAGGDGNDVIRGSRFADLLDGGGGNDTLYLDQPSAITKSADQSFGPAFDQALGGDGNDVFLFGAVLTSFDRVDGGAGTDQIAIQGDYAGANALTLGANVVSVENLALLSGDDTRFGDPGTGFYDYSITTVDGNVAAGAQMVVDANRLRVGEDFTFNGSAETDGTFFIYGGSGLDLLTGGAKNDVFLFGAQGQWSASDVINGGSGGIDQLALRGNYTVTFGAGQLIGIENIGLLSAHDTRFGTLGSSYSYDLTMVDANVAAGVQMVVDGAKLRIAETFRFDGSAELDGSFRLFGGLVDDIIVASRNSDFIQGNGGADSLTGGAGADVFRYVSTSDSTASAMDHILDFAAGSDKIDLSKIDADTLTAEDQAFSWIGSNAFSGTAGQYRAYQDGSSWFVEGDTDGDGDADLVIQLTVNGGPLTQADFLP